tara:strand:- start:2405 stop:3514 length:1110 start_codon:yes stop_codon:yes gene_type:complete
MAARLLERYLLRPFEILIKGPGRFALGRIIPSSKPRVFYGYERIPGRDEPASGGIVKLQDLSEEYPNCRWRANTLYLISSCYPWTVRWQVKTARFFGAKIVLNQNGVAYPAWKPEGWEEENQRAAWIHHRASAVVYQSQFCRKCALEWLRENAPEKNEVLLNPVDLETFRPVVRSIESEFTLLLAGSHQFGYRVRTALETLSALDDSYVLVVAGAYNWKGSESEAMEEAKAWARELKVEDRVEFRGRYLQSEAPDLFGTSHLLLHTKVMDPCPRLVAEALATGLPVVYASSGGLPEMVSEEAGVGVVSTENFETEEPADSRGFAVAVKKVRADYERYSRGARVCAKERFDRKPWIEEHGKLFRSVKEGN